MNAKSKVSFRKPPGAQALPARAGGLALSREGDVAIELDLSLIDFDEDQHRQDIDDAGIREMAESIKANGVLQAIVVLPANAAGRYKLVIGERRVRGCLLLGLQTISALVRQLTALEADIAQVVENEQRKNVNPLHTARKLRRMLDKHRRLDGSEMEHAELAKKIGKGETYVSQHLRLLDLPPSVAALAENTVLRDVDTLTNIAKLFEVDQPAAAELVGKAEAGQKVTRAETSGALRDAKAKRKAKSEPVRDPRTHDFMNGKADAEGVQKITPGGKVAPSRMGLEIVVVPSARSELNLKHWRTSLQGGRAVIEFSSLIAAQPGSFRKVQVLFEKSGVILADVLLGDLIILEINKL